MNIRDLFNKKKLICDDIILITLFLSILVIFVFFRLIVFVSMMFYPFASLFLYGIFYTYKGLSKKDRSLTTRMLRLILGIVSLAFSTSMILLIFSYPHITLSYVIYFLSLPTLFIGLAAILKGSIVKVYTSIYRKLNILIGFLTFCITFLALYYAEAYFILSLISLLFLLILNGILRFGLYLSEYGLSIRYLENIRLVFYIMDNLQMINPEEVQS
ncbi:MAG: hypothetical protein ACTSR7_19145 [Promethearchaeota archaeon]